MTTRKGRAMSQVKYFAPKQAIGPGRRSDVPRMLLVLFGVLAGCMILAASPALAGRVRLLTGVFGAAGSTPADPYPLGEGEGAAVDVETHDVYVVDSENSRVEEFDSAGHFILMFGKEVNLTTGGDVCTAISGNVCQAGVAGTSPGAFQFKPEFTSFAGIAVDNSGVFGQQGDVYVSDAFVISKFDSEGNLISNWGNNGEGTEKNGPPNGQLNGSNATGAIAGPFHRIEGIATDPSGNIWVKAAEGSAFEFRPSSSFVTAWSGVLGRPIAVDSEETLYMGSEAIKFDSVGISMVAVHGGVGQEGGGLTVDQVSNDLYEEIGGFRTSDVIYRYDASCHPGLVEGIAVSCAPAESFGANVIGTEEPMGLTIDPGTSADTLYATELSGSVDSGVVHPSRVLAFSIETVPDVVTTKAAGFGAGSANFAWGG